MPARSASQSAPRVVVITGASSGIGRATAHAFTRCGGAVVPAARRAELSETVPDGAAVSGGRRAAPGIGGDGLAALSSAASPPFRFAVGSTATCRFPEGLAPSGPPSKSK